jgi:hypothetical protein
MFAVAAEPQQFCHDQLRAIAFARARNGFADDFQARGQIRAVNGMGFDAVTDGFVARSSQAN